MARAAVKAKQQARAKAQPTKPVRARGRRRHSGGGNPNQQLFFMRLRRGQRWVYLALAIIFAVTFVGVGVGSGSGGLSQLYSGLFGAGGNPVSKAQDKVDKDPKNPQGYRALATAYETKGDAPNAIAALKHYVGLKKKDADAWTELGGLETSQAQVYVNQYQSAQSAAQLADPSAPFLPGGTLAQAVGTNAAYQNASQQASSQTSTLYQQAISALNAAVTDYQQVAKIQPKSSAAQQQIAQAAENAGNLKVAIAAWTKYLKLAPSSPQKKQIEARIKQLKKSQAGVSSSSSATSSSSNGGSSSSSSSGGSTPAYP
jgi:tetratricopeptide (TPR) repeat protein